MAARWSRIQHRNIQTLKECQKELTNSFFILSFGRTLKLYSFRRKVLNYITLYYSYCLFAWCTVLWRPTLAKFLQRLEGGFWGKRCLNFIQSTTIEIQVRATCLRSLLLTSVLLWVETLSVCGKPTSPALVATYKAKCC